MSALLKTRVFYSKEFLIHLCKPFLIVFTENMQILLGNWNFPGLNVLAAISKLVFQIQPARKGFSLNGVIYF